jgi:hypothetical protein
MVNNALEVTFGLNFIVRCPPHSYIYSFIKARVPEETGINSTNRNHGNWKPHRPWKWTDDGINEGGDLRRGKSRRRRNALE